MVASGSSPKMIYTSTPPRPYTRWSFRVLLVCLVLLVVTTVCVLLWVTGVLPPRTESKRQFAGGSEFRRELAGKLLSVGLINQAVEQYQLYLKENDLAPATRADIAFTIGKLCAEQGRYEDALTWLYQVEMLDPTTPHKTEVASKIVSCLERLGKYSAAAYTLEARTSSGSDKQEGTRGTKVVAKIGNDVITLEAIDRAIDTLPEWMRETLKDPAKKEEFVRHYVAEELLFRKAQRLEYDKDPQVRTQAEMALRQIMIQKVLEKEVKDKIKITDDDIALYHKANQDRYTEKEAVRVQVLKVADKDKAAVVDALTKKTR